MSTRISESVRSPFLAQFAVLRTGTAAIEGRFCRDSDVWVVDDEEGVRPIIHTRSDLAETRTVTRVRVEQDDTDISAVFEASTSTHTAVSAEADDQDRTPSALLEVTTKTDANVERDDVVKGLEAFEPQRSMSLPIGIARLQ